VTPSEACFSHLRGFEGLSLKAIRDVGTTWEIGYGHDSTPEEPVHPSDEITEADAEELLERDVAKIAVEVDELLDGAEVTQNQYDAFICLAYNIGPHALMGSTLLQLFWQGDIQGAADEFLKWDHVGGLVNAGLAKRRAAERAMFLGEAAA